MPLQVLLEPYEVAAVLEVLTSPEGSAIVRSGQGKRAIGDATIKLENAEPLPQGEPPSEATGDDLPASEPETAPAPSET